MIVTARVLVADDQPDVVDALRLGGGRVAVSIADVTGKGLPAAFLMSNVQASVRAFAAQQSSPRYVAEAINRALCGNPALRTFATFFYAETDSRTWTLTFSNAGHNPPILARSNGSVERLSTGGLVLGVNENASYEQSDLRLAAGDRIVLFTDGLNEAEDADGNDFGDDRLVESVVANRTQSAAALRQRLRSCSRVHGQPLPRRCHAHYGCHPLAPFPARNLWFQIRAPGSAVFAYHLLQ
jgi:phosphoserine phosphatase RsbU/P